MDNLQPTSGRLDHGACRSALLFLLIISLLFVQPFAYAQPSWNQLGAAIDGGMGDGIGETVSISADGLTMAVGSGFGPNATNTGLVRVYTWSGSAWTQKGADINGEAANESFGSSISLSDNGNIIAIGASTKDLTSSFAPNGRVQVYEWSGSSWGQKGSNLDGVDDFENFGEAISLSGDGSRLAVGIPGQDTNGATAGGETGAVRVYQFTTDWNLLGTEIAGNEDLSVFGSAVSLDQTGTTLAVGNPFYTGGGSSLDGQVSVYRWNGSAWEPKGNTVSTIIGGEQDALGTSVSLSNNGNRLAIGAPDSFFGFGPSYIGHVQVWEYDSETWTQLGTDIISNFDGDSFGKRIQLSGDGTHVVIGATGNFDMNNPNGRAQIWKYNATAWEQVGVDIVGEVADDGAGTSVALSDDGSIVAVGAPANSGGGASAGQVSVLEFGLPPVNAAPVITSGQSFDIDENAEDGAGVGTVLATDADANPTFSNWSITAGNDDGVFAIAASTGQITIADNTTLDFETTVSYTLTLTVSDGTDTSEEEDVTITVNDLNDNAPVITASQSFDVDENAADGVTIGTVQATDADTNPTLSNWTITAGNDDGNFEINSTTAIITVANGATLDFETTTSYTLTLTVSDGTLTSPPVEVTINIGDIDEVAPTVTITSVLSSPTNANSIPITITFNESVTGLEASEIVVDGADKGALMGSGDSYTIDLTPSGDGTITVNINANVAQDLANNANTGAEQFSIISDRTRPQVFMYGAAPDFSELTAVNSPFDISVTFPGAASFGEVVNGFESDDIELTNGATAGAPELVAGNPNYYRVSITPGTDDFTITIAADRVTDDAGNGNIEKQISLIYDITPPTPVITSEASGLTNLAAIPITVTFEEPGAVEDLVTQFVAEDITVVGATISDFAGEGSTYTMNLVPPANTNGTITVDIAADVAEDKAGNANLVAQQFTIDYDLTIPRPTITLGDYTNSKPIPASISLSEELDGFGIANVSVTGASIANFTPSANNTYTFNLAIAAGTDSTKVTVSIAAAQFADVAGNGNLAATATIIYDTRAPVPVITSLSYHSGAAFGGMVKINEEVVGFTRSDLRIDGGSIGSLEDGVFQITPSEPYGDITIRLPAARFTDLAGNPNGSVEVKVIHDNTPPSVASIVSSAGTVTKDEAFQVTITFEEGDIRELQTSDLKVGNGEIRSFNKVDNRTYQSVIEAIAEGAVTISIDESFTDLAGNKIADRGDLSVTYDPDPPTIVSLAFPDGQVTNKQSVLAVVTFSEEVVNVDENNFFPIEREDVGLTSLTTEDKIVYTALITFVKEGLFDLSFLPGSTTDLAGNALTEGKEFSINYELIPPTVTIKDVPQTIASRDPFKVTFEFSEAVTGFEPLDISISNNVTVSNLEATSTSVFTADITPGENLIDGAMVTIGLAAGLVQDEAGNGNLAAIEVSTTLSIPQPYSGGKGTEADPYLIANSQDYIDLTQRSQDWSGHFLQTADINFGGTQLTRIGTFTGSYDGGGFDLMSFSLRSGLFTELASEAKIMNLNVINDYQISDNFNENGSFSLLADDCSGLIKNCSYTGNFSLASNSLLAFGFAGFTKNLIGTGKIYDSKLNANVSITLNRSNSSASVGGLTWDVGPNAEIKNSSIQGQINLTADESANLGGIAMSNSGLIENTFSGMSLTARAHDRVSVGGIATSNSGVIRYCYATGSASGSGPFNGGFQLHDGDIVLSNSGLIENTYTSSRASTIAAYNNGTIRNSFSSIIAWQNRGSIIDCYARIALTVINDGSITNSYWLNETNTPSGNLGGTVTNSFWQTETGTEAGNNGALPKTRTQLTNKKTFTDAGWDFQDTWSYPWSYPVHKWLFESNRSYTVSGKVVDENDQAFTTGKVVGYKYPGGNSEVQIDEAGNFVIDLPGGINSLYVEPSNDDQYFTTYLGNTINPFKAQSTLFANSSVTIKMIAKSQAILLDGNGRVSGNIVGGTSGGRIVQGRTLDGDPVEGVSLTLLRVADEEVMTTVETDENGYFEITGIPAGEYQLVLGVAGIDLNLEGSTFTVDEKGTPLVISAEIGEEGVSFTIVEVLGVEDQIDIAVYPNPVIDYLNIKVEGKATLRLIDLSGATVHEESFVNEAQLDVRRLVPGVHFLEISNSQGRSVRKLIKAN